MKWNLITMSTLMVLLLSACERTGFFLANLTNDNAGYARAENISYGTEAWQRLDVYTPKNASTKTHPVVVFFYGGGWSSGNKEQYQFVADTLVQHGFVVVIPDYQKYPPAKYPAFQQDAAAASKWVLKNISRYQGNTKHMHLLGHSAGAHIALMLLSDKKFLAAEKLSPDIYRSGVGLAGPYHFTPTEAKYQAIFGPEDRYPSMWVTEFIDGSEPPMLLLHGEKDNLVGKFNTEKLTAKIRANGGSVKTIFYPKENHFSIIGGFSGTLGREDPVVRDVLTFFKEHS